MRGVKTGRGNGKARRAGWVLAVALGAVLLCQSQAADRYVAQNGQTPAANYTSWATAASNIQDAVNAAAAGDTVLIGKGRYTAPSSPTNYLGPNVVYIDKPLTLLSSNGVASEVVIDGEGVNRGITWNYAAVTANRFVLQGLIVSNCYGGARGGGILYGVTYGWTTQVSNCEIVDNVVDGAGTSTGNGGGVYLYNNNSQAFAYGFSNCTFRGNRAITLLPPTTNGFGGGLYLGVNSPGGGSVVDCAFENNTASAGGAVYVNAAGVTATSRFERCVFRGNRAEQNVDSSHGGGAIYQHVSPVALWNCLVYGNTSVTFGGAFRPAKGNSVLSLFNCTVVKNTAPSGYAGGIDTRNSNDYVQVVNSIVCSNQTPGASYNVDIRLVSPAGDPLLHLFTNSCIGRTNYLVNYGNIVTNSPQFVDFAGGDFRLSSGSPCINGGVNQSWMESAVDLDGNPRVDQGNGFVDIGCYEYVFPGGTLIMTR